MGKLKMFGLSFSNEGGVYYAGQMIQGQAIIELRDTMNMRGVYLSIHGSATVQWTEVEETGPGYGHGNGSGSHHHTRTVRYSNSETFLDRDILIAGRYQNQAGEDIQLSAGRHVLPFSFPLPAQLPSSFEEQYGHIRYTIKGTIDKSWNFDDTTKRSFTVIGLMDLNRDIRASMPAVERRSKSFYCLCCITAPVTVTVKLDRRGYIPGEAVLIYVEIDNQSNMDMSSSDVVVIMETRFHAARKTKTINKEVAWLTLGGILEGATEHWNTDKLVIPPLPPSYLEGCSIIDIRYKLGVRVSPCGLASDLEVPMEIIIGTIPLSQIPGPGNPNHLGGPTTLSPRQHYPLGTALPPPGAASSSIAPYTSQPSRRDYGERSPLIDNRT